MKEGFKKIGQVFTGPNGRVSSKRVCGVIGWAVVLWVVVHCTLNDTQAPDITEYVTIVSASLMGIGVFETYNWKKSKVKNPLPQDGGEGPEEPQYQDSPANTPEP